MKKFLTFFAFALLTAAVCTTLTACGGDDDDDDDLPNVPENVKQARRMMIGQWRWPDYLLDSFEDELYSEFGEDGHYYVIRHIKADAPDGAWYSRYKGKYVGYIQWDNYIIEPNPDDPTKGHFTLYDNDQKVSEGWSPSYSNLTKSSFIWGEGEYKRPKEPIVYILINN